MRPVLGIRLGLVAVLVSLPTLAAVKNHVSTVKMRFTFIAVFVSIRTLAAIKNHDVSDTNKRTWCEDPELAEETQKVTITFYISSEASREILSKNLALYINHYKDSEDEETVYLCHVPGRKLICTQNDKDYNLSLTENFTDSDNQIKLIIVNASKKHVGRYGLTFDGFPHDRCVPCNLTLRNTTRNEGDVSSPTSTVHLVVGVVVGVAVVGVVVGVAVVGVAVATVLILKRKRQATVQQTYALVSREHSLTGSHKAPNCGDKDGHGTQNQEA